MKSAKCFLVASLAICAAMLSMSASMASAAPHEPTSIEISAAPASIANSDKAAAPATVIQLNARDAVAARDVSVEPAEPARAADLVYDMSLGVSKRPAIESLGIYADREAKGRTSA